MTQYYFEDHIIQGGTIDGTPIGGTTPASGAFTSLKASTDPVDEHGVGDRGFNDARYAGTGGTVVYTTDGTINLTIPDLNKIYVIEKASAVVVNLPSVSASEIGYFLEVQKLGAGNLTINRADSDSILDGTAIANTEAAQTFAFLRLILGTATAWRMQGSLGSWSTS